MRRCGKQQEGSSKHTSSAAKTVAARRASRAREDHLKLTIVPDSEGERGGDDEEEKKGKGGESLEFWRRKGSSKSRLKLGGIAWNVVASVQSGNWDRAHSFASCAHAPAPGGACVGGLTPNIRLSNTMHLPTLPTYVVIGLCSFEEGQATAAQVGRPAKQRRLAG